MKRVGILGGTFNPPHIGHLIMATEVQESLALDSVRFMPNAIPPHKQLADHVADEHRLEMTKLAISTNPYFEVETAEIERAGVSYTIDTMKELMEKEPDTRFFFIIGADMIEYLPHWHRIDELVRLVKFIGVKRPGYSVKTPYPVTLIDAPEVNVSSTMIRENAAIGRTLRYVLPDPVIAYIKERRLYEA